jgi:signal transduction histidine kinase
MEIPPTAQPSAATERTDLESLNRRIAQLEEENRHLKQTNSGLQQQITKLSQTLEGAERSRDRYQYVLMHALAGVNISLGNDFISELSNPTYLKIVGREAAIQGKPLREVFPELLGQGFFELMEEVYRSGEPFVGKQTPVLLDRNGDGTLDEGFFNFVYHPVRTTEGQTEGVFVHAVEITEQVRAQQALENERQRLQTIFMNAPASIAVLRGPDHTFEIANASYMKLVGRETPIVGLTLLEALPEIAEQGFKELLDRVYQSGQPFTGQEVAVRLDRTGHGQLEEVHLNFVYQPLFAPDNSTVEGIFVHAVEVTEQVRTRKQVEELSRLKDEFLAVASHDLRTPVTSIKGYGQLLQRNLLRQQQVQLARAATDPAALESDTKFFENTLRVVTTVLNQINRLNELINRLLDFSRIVEGQLSLQYTPQADLVKLVQETVANLGMTTEDHQIVMQPLSPTPAPLKVNYDEARLEQVLNNLISNAIKYSPSGTQVTVGIEPPAPGQTEVIIWVRDQGHGISPEEQQHLFERFYRVRNRPLNDRNGLGLGLYISAEIVKQHGGWIWVESASGQGSTFYVALPLASDTI